MIYNYPIVIAVVNNLNEACIELKELSKKYKLTVGIKQLFKDNCKLHSLDPYFHLKNDRWIIWYSNNECIYLCLTPYSEWCKYYLERKGVIKK